MPLPMSLIVKKSLLVLSSAAMLLSTSFAFAEEEPSMVRITPMQGNTAKIEVCNKTGCEQMGKGVYGEAELRSIIDKMNSQGNWQAAGIAAVAIVISASGFILLSAGSVLIGSMGGLALPGYFAATVMANASFVLLGADAFATFVGVATYLGTNALLGMGAAWIFDQLPMQYWNSANAVEKALESTTRSFSSPAQTDVVYTAEELESLNRALAAIPNSGIEKVQVLTPVLP